MITLKNIKITKLNSKAQSLCGGEFYTIYQLKPENHPTGAYTYPVATVNIPKPVCIS